LFIFALDRTKYISHLYNGRIFFFKMNKKKHVTWVCEGEAVPLTFKKYEHLCTIDAKCKDGKLVDWSGGHALDLPKIALQKGITIDNIEDVGKGVTHATITFHGKTHDKTQFPSFWNEEMRLRKIKESLANPITSPEIRKSGRYIHIGITSCGVIIQTIIDKSAKEIVSSFPDFEKMKELKEYYDKKTINN